MDMLYMGYMNIYICYNQYSRSYIYMTYPFNVINLGHIWLGCGNHLSWDAHPSECSAL